MVSTLRWFVLILFSNICISQDAYQYVLDGIDNAISTDGIVKFSTGEFILSQKMTFNVSESHFSMIGEGPEQTTFIIDSNDNNDGFIEIICTNRNVNITMSDFTIKCLDTLGCGTAIRIEYPEGGGVRHERALIMRDVEVQVDDPFEGYWNNGIILRGVQRPLLDNVVVNNAFAATSDLDSSPKFNCEYGIDAFKCFGPHIVNSYVWSAEVGIRAGSDLSPGAEGLLIDNTTIVGTKKGVVYSTPGNEPGFQIKGTHINSRDVCIEIDGSKEAIISHVLFYNKDDDGVNPNPIGIHIINGFDFQITDNNFHFASAAANRNWIKIDRAYNAAEMWMIANNRFNAGASINMNFSAMTPAEIALLNIINNYE